MTETEGLEGLHRSKDAGTKALLFRHCCIPLALPACCSAGCTPAIGHLSPDHALNHHDLLLIDVLGEALEVVVIGEKVGGELERFEVGEELEHSAKARESERSRGILGDSQVANR